jgi:hypothetical protein
MCALLPQDFQEPIYIKLDVDGLEAEILKGGAEILQSVKGVLVELTGETNVQNQIREHLESAGMRLVDSGRHNEVWVRN